MKNSVGNLEAYKRTAIFTEKTVPRSLQKSHDTKEGTWAKLVVQTGELLLHFVSKNSPEILVTPDTQGWIKPQEPHYIELLVNVRFYIEFYRMQS